MAIAAVVVLWASPAAAQWVDAGGVLVVFNDSWPDQDGNGKSDSRDVAEYYAWRRGIPSQNLLAVTCGTGYTLAYEDFYRDILTPLHDKLETYDGTIQFRRKIYYVALCYGIPVCVNTHIPKSSHPLWPSGSYSCDVRALDGYLMDVYYNFAGGYDPSTGCPTNADGTLLGDDRAEIENYYYGALGYWSNPSQVHGATFKGIRDTYFPSIPLGFPEYLVARLDGAGTEIAKGLADKALYAERYLRDQASPTHPYAITVLIDSDEGAGHGHEARAARMSNYVQGLDGYSPWNPVNSAQSWYIGPRFDTVFDWNTSDQEIGEAGHLPLVKATMDQPPSGDVIHLSAVPTEYGAYFFPIGGTVQSNSGGSATVLSLDGSARTLTLDTVAGFNDGDTVTWLWLGSFPISPMFTYTFYDYRAYRDVYTFPVGAVGKHMDSGSGENIRSSGGTWCAKALIRNIASTSGAVAEPSNEGENKMDYTMFALAEGTNAVDAWYNGIYFGKRWMALVITDPLYHPLRSFGTHVEDTTPPVIATVVTTQTAADSRRIEVNLGGSGEAALDVCQFRIDYGADPSYGSVYDFYDYPGTLDGLWNSSRRYFFSRHLVCTLTGLQNNQVYHFRVTARDPYGNETDTGDQTFTQGTPVGLSVSPSGGFVSSGPTGGPFSLASATYLLSNTSPDPIDWTASKTAAWLDLSSGGGTLAAGSSITVVVSLNSAANGLAAGTYTDTVSFANTTNGTGNTDRAVSLTVNPRPGVLSVTPAGDFASSGLTGGPFSPTSTSYALSNTGGLPIDWTASKTAAWLDLSSGGGALAAGSSVTVQVSLTAAANGLAAGTHTDTVSFVNVTNHDGDTTRAVSLTVNPRPGVLSVSPGTGFASSGFTGGPFSPTSGTYTLSNTGELPIDWTASKTAAWLDLSSGGGALAAGSSVTVQVSLTAAAGALSAGTYRDAVSFANATSGSGDTTRPVELLVNVLPATISQSPGSLIANAVQGQNAPSQTFEVWNAGGGSLSYALASSASWISAISPAAGGSSGAANTHTVTFDTAGLMVGTYTTRIAISAPGATNDPQALDVTLVVGALSPESRSSGGGGGGGCTFNPDRTAEASLAGRALSLAVVFMPWVVVLAFRSARKRRHVCEAP